VIENLGRQRVRSEVGGSQGRCATERSLEAYASWLPQKSSVAGCVFCCCCGSGGEMMKGSSSVNGKAGIVSARRVGKVREQIRREERPGAVGQRCPQRKESERMSIGLRSC
jgi:hypothetical protein